MIGILLVSHSGFASGLLNCVELLVGSSNDIMFEELNESDNYDKFISNVYDKIQSLDKGYGVIVFTDILGASPYNACAINLKKILKNHNIRIISGMNLPMLITSIYERENLTLDELYKEVIIAGKNGIEEMVEEYNKIQN